MDEEKVPQAVKFTPDDSLLAEMIEAGRNPDDTKVHEFVCEACDTVANLTDRQAYDAGWDYPPFIGLWGILSPRTCPDCGIEATAYWQVIQDGELTERHKRTILRVMKEEPR